MISVVVPTFNEVENIEKLLERIEKAFLAFPKAHETVVIDDYSTDGTWELLLKLKKKFPLRVFRKEGEKGKSYSLVEGFSKASGNILVMIDADLQYPPEAIPEMVLGLDEGLDIVVANRKDYQAPAFRKTFSKIFKFVFGRVLHGIGCDVQSGLKVFRRQVFGTVKFIPKSQWSFDLEFLVMAKNAGFSMGEMDIVFEKRQAGESKVSFIKNGWDLATNALALKTLRQAPVHIKPEDGEAMRGAGIGFLGRKFITHTTLSHRKSAIVNFTFWQKAFLALSLFLVGFGLFADPLRAVAIVIALLSTIYFLDVIFNFYLVLRSLQSSPDISFSPAQIAAVGEDKLPVYSILCPLYREARVLPGFLKAIDACDWPKEKLDVLLLLEEDDKETVEAVDRVGLPKYIRKVIVPQSLPKTKPKACNFGLSQVKGEYVVIYDAEDIPDPAQLKKAYLAFSKLPREVVCLQAKLNYFNPGQNLLTRLFTAEYSLWFDLSLPGMQSVNTSIPLGGTSNHFRTDDLKRLEGWDPFNVTEDADLGVRLFKAGYKTAIIDSTTFEEANSRLGNWIRQRSRWIKGYMQTYLVHTRNPVEFIRENGIHAFIFQLIVGGKIAFIFINPILWAATISYFALNRLVGPTIEALYPAQIFYMAVISLVFGNFLFIYYYMIGCAKREQWGLMKYVFLVPFYWLLVSVAGVKALYQLIFKPHFWEKTVHGLHLGMEEAAAPAVAMEGEEVPDEAREGRLRKLKALASVGMVSNFLSGERFQKSKLFLKSGISDGGTILVASSLMGSIFNFLYNAYLGRVLTVSDFGLISLIGSFLFLSTIPLSSLSRSVTYKAAYYLGKHNTAIKKFWAYWRRRSIVVALVVTALWILATPYLAVFFKSNSLVPFYLFAPVWLIGTASAVDLGFIGGNLKFVVLAILAISVAISKFILSFIFVELGRPDLVYAAIPLSMTVSFLIGWYYAVSMKEKPRKIDEKEVLSFPGRFYVSSVFTKSAEVAFFTLDVILAKHFLDPIQAGEYAMISLVGKMIFFIGGLFSQFILPVVSREEGAKRNSHKVFYKLFFASAAVSFFAYLGVGLFGFISAPVLLGDKILPVVYLLPLYGFAMFCFQVADTIVTFHQARSKHFFAFASIVMGVTQIIGIGLFHQNLEQIVWVMSAVGIANVVVMLLLHFFYDSLTSVGRNLLDFVSIASPLPQMVATSEAEAQSRLLIFNWRDVKHVWGGGAEVYIHELSKRLVKQGYEVTVFCGNDGHSLRHEVVDGVKIIRRGGFYTVYVWAFLYYIFKLRRNTDIVIDSENGIPFFTPIYVGKPVLGLVFHVHQEIFKRHLKFPLSQVAKALEADLMPLVYRNSKLVTISNSSKEDMERIGLGKRFPIKIIRPGVDLSVFKPGFKTDRPSVLYLGRLKPYKSVETAILALEQVRRQVPSATLTIAGDGESRKSLERLVAKLNLANTVRFLGKVTEKTKAKLYAQSWLMVQPSKMEGWGITAIEANASGTPVVAANVPGLRESVSNPHSGYLVPWGDTNKFAEKIGLILTDRNVRRELELGSIEWSRQFSWDRSAENLVKLLKNLKEGS